jgi:hypothetical protein
MFRQKSNSKFPKKVQREPIVSFLEDLNERNSIEASTSTERKSIMARVKGKQYIEQFPCIIQLYSSFFF